MGAEDAPIVGQLGTSGDVDFLALAEIVVGLLIVGEEVAHVEIEGGNANSSFDLIAPRVQARVVDAEPVNEIELFDRRYLRAPDEIGEVIADPGVLRENVLVRLDDLEALTEKGLRNKWWIPQVAPRRRPVYGRTTLGRRLEGGSDSQRWWRRWDSNPRPKNASWKPLRV